jgi:hypothetical protein
VAIDILFSFEHAVFTTKKSAKSYVQLFTQRILSASPNDAGFIIPLFYWCRDQSGRSGLSQSSGFPVVMAFQSFQLSGLYSCPVILSCFFLSLKKRRNAPTIRRVLLFAFSQKIPY